MRRNIGSPRRSTLLVALLALLLAAPGCATFGWLSHVVSGPPKVKPRYVPAQEPMLVLVENFRSSGGNEIDSEQLAGYIGHHLKENKVVPLIEARKLNEVKAAAGDKYRKMNLRDVGAAVGAKQVLYVDLQDSKVAIPAGGGLYQGAVKTSVKIVAVDSGRTLWPRDSTDGYPLNYQTNWMSQGDHINESAARDDLLRNTGMTIARLFYEYESGN